MSEEEQIRVIVPSREEKVHPALPAAALTLLVGAAFHFALAPDPTSGKLLFVSVGSIYSVFAILAVLRLRSRRELSLLRPKSGDLTVAILLAGILYGLGYAGAAVFMARGTPHEGWLFHVYLLLRDAFTDRRHWIGAMLFAIGGLEELSWRGLVLPMLESRIGTLRSTVLVAGLWALAHAPTIYRLSDPIAGPNPLLVVAALGTGLVWGYVRFRTDRLAVVLLSHAFFSWAIVEFPIWHP